MKRFVLAVAAAVLSLSGLAAAPAAGTDDDPVDCDQVIEVENEQTRVELVFDDGRCLPVPGGPCRIGPRLGRFDELLRCICEQTTTTVPPVLGPVGPQGPAGETVIVEVPVETVVVDRDQQPAIPATPRRSVPTFTG